VRLDGKEDEYVHCNDGEGENGADNRWVHISDRDQSQFLRSPEAIMAIMDTTQTDKMLSDLAAVDSADAPDIADELAVDLTEKLEASSPPPAEQESPEEAP
jgi:hypothetical protein